MLIIFISRYRPMNKFPMGSIEQERKLNTEGLFVTEK